MGNSLSVLVLFSNVFICSLSQVHSTLRTVAMGTPPVWQMSEAFIPSCHLLTSSTQHRPKKYVTYAHISVLRVISFPSGKRIICSLQESVFVVFLHQRSIVPTWLSLLTMICGLPRKLKMRFLSVVNHLMMTCCLQRPLILGNLWLNCAVLSLQVDRRTILY